MVFTQKFRMILTFGVATIVLSGCATFSQTIFSKPVIEDDLAGERIDTLAMTADRRLAIFKSYPTADTKTGGIRMCAEALPDVAISKDMKSSLNGALKAIKKDSISITSADELKEILTVAYQRTERSDLVRQLGWQICQGYINGAIDDDEYHQLLAGLIAASIVNPDDKNSVDTVNSFLSSAK